MKKNSSTSLIKILILVISVNIFCSSFSTNYSNQVEDADIHILLIGSSYFSYNNLPSLVRKLTQAEEKKVFIDYRIRNGTYLDFHASDQTTEAKIKQSPWDYVILQGCGSNAGYPDTHHLIFPPYVRHPLRSSLETLKQKILNNNDSTKIVYCLPWAFEDGTTWIQGQNDSYEDMQKKIYDNVTSLVNELDIMTAPVGWAWYKVLQDSSKLHYLHRSDWNHPSLRGSYLMACVIYSTLYLDSLGDANYYAGLPKDEALYFQKVASQTVLDDPEVWNLINED